MLGECQDVLDFGVQQLVDLYLHQWKIQARIILKQSRDENKNVARFKKQKELALLFRRRGKKTFAMFEKQKCLKTTVIDPNIVQTKEMRSQAFIPEIGVRLLEQLEY
ncbi:hypothetical protein C0J52_25607 [Blattella germanica]|nr:hypothetical protein C0J52_25607 [Blattella germanica]